MNSKTMSGSQSPSPLSGNDAEPTNELSQKIAEQIELVVEQDPELSGKIPPELVERLSQNKAIIAQFSRTEQFQGPFPHPQTLEQYNKVLPGAAERIFSLTENEQSHRHEIQKTAVAGSISRDRRGQWMGYTITIAVLAIAVFFAYRGNTAFAGALITVDLVALAAIFVSGKSKSSKGNLPPPSQ